MSVKRYCPTGCEIGCDVYCTPIGMAENAEGGYVLATDYDAATARAEAAEAELRALLERVVKYVREDRARTPGVTRLDRLTEEIEGVLAALAETEGGTT